MHGKAVEQGMQSNRLEFAVEAGAGQSGQLHLPDHCPRQVE